MNTPVAVRSLVAESTDGKRFDITLNIGAPRQEEDHWVCLVAVEGMPHQPHLCHGTDSLQALLLGVGHVRSQLNRFVGAGGKLYWPGDEDSGSMSVSELFSVAA